MIQLRVEYVGAGTAVAVFFTTKNEHFTVADWAGAEPVLDVILEGLRPDFDQFPI